MNIDPGWVAAGLLFVTSGGGLIYTAVRNGKSQARRFGNMEGKMEGFCNGLKTRMDSVETSVNNLGQRIDSLMDGYPKRGRRTKKS